MPFLKIFKMLGSLLLIMIVVSGCNWRRAESDSKGAAVETEDGAVVVADSALILENFRELKVSSDGMVAGSYDGKLTWSPDGTLVAIGMSNQTLASAQTQLVEVASGRRAAVLGGYNVRWDETNPDRLFFSRHQYYGPPDYGSFEEVIAVSQAELLRAEVFNEDMNYEVVAEGEIEIGTLPEGVWQTATWQGREIQVRTERGQTGIYTGENTGQTKPLLISEKNYNAFALDSDGNHILIREVTGTADEFGNLDATDANTKFLIAEIVLNN